MELLYFIALAWILFATFQDLKTREVANWLNYSLIAIGLIGKAILSVSQENWKIFAFAVIGFAFYYGIANLFYYTRVFAGGDAKLLMGIGVILPYDSWLNLGIYGIGFIILLFLIGAGYTLVYSVFLVRHNKNKFFKEFAGQLKKNKIFIGIIWSIVILILLITKLDSLLFIALGILFILPGIYCYLKAVEKTCLIVSMAPAGLQEGDWLLRDIKLKGKTIKASVHGLNKSEINLLKKQKKKILIKQGIPFMPAFLGAWLLMGYGALLEQFQTLVSSLFFEA